VVARAYYSEAIFFGATLAYNNNQQTDFRFESSWMTKQKQEVLHAEFHNSSSLKLLELVGTCGDFGSTKYCG
jgi:hypothetical protein